MLLLGHRGYVSRTHAENTLGAFQASLSLGAHGIEFDMRLSRDGEIVLVHDKDLRRIAGNAHLVNELTAAELAALPLRHGGHILRLSDITSTFAPPVVLDMEVKDPAVLPQLIAKLQTSAGLRERTIVSSFHLSVLQEIRRHCPDVRTLLLVLRWPLPLRGKVWWDKILKLAPSAVGMPLLRLTEDRVQFLRSLGVQVAAWDNRGAKSEARKAARLGIDIAIVRCVDEVK